MAQPVFLLHGIARTSRCMAKLARFLEQQGYEVHNIDYPSTRHTIADLADYLHPIVAKVTATNPEPVSFIGYSMGGLVIRAYLTRYRPQHLGRIVMLGTPNQGSEVADALKNLWPFRWIYGPAGQQLTTTRNGYGELFGPVDYETGIIAGDRPFDLFCSWIIGHGKDDKANDGKVSVTSTKLSGMTDHIVVSTNHTFMPGHKDVLQQTAYFLQNGAFKR